MTPRTPEATVSQQKQEARAKGWGDKRNGFSLDWSPSPGFNEIS
jgi:hypothetical protein